MLIHLISLALIHVGYMAGTGDTDSRLPVELLDFWQAGVNAIQSYDLTTELKTATSLSIEPDGRSILKGPMELPVVRTRLMRQSSKRRAECNLDAHHGQPNLLLIGDEESVNSYVPHAKVVTVDSHALAFGDNEYDDYESLYHTMGGTFDRIQLMRERGIRSLTKDGKLFVLAVSATEKGSFNNLGWRVWLDPDKNFLPVKLEQWVLRDGKQLPDRLSVIRLSEFQPGVWAPEESDTIVYIKNNKNQELVGKPAYRAQLVVDRNQSKFNVALPSEMFSKEISNGFTVQDRLRGVTYTKGSDQVPEHLENIAVMARESVKHFSPKYRNQPVPVADRPPYWRELMLPICVALLAGSVLVWWRRR